MASTRSAEEISTSSAASTLQARTDFRIATLLICNCLASEWPERKVRRICSRSLWPAVVPMSAMRLLLLSALILCLSSPWLRGQSEFGFVNTRPSGQPYLTPEESLRRLRMPPGWEVKVFAAEPDIINPISFTVDEKGRLWVVECYEYPRRTPPGKKRRDRIKVLEDTTGAGKADKVTIWSEGKDLPRFDLASGIEVGRGGVFLGAAPYLFFLQDTTGAGHCDKYDI